MEAPWRNLAAIMVGLCIMLSTGLAAVGIVTAADSGHRACGQINALRVAVTQVLDNSAKGLPASPYFKHRPDQLRLAERQIHDDLRLFQPVSCG